MSKSKQNNKEGVEMSSKEDCSNSRRMKVLVNGKGNPWICDCDVDPSNDLAEQGCWQFREDESNQGNEGNARQRRSKIF